MVYLETQYETNFIVSSFYFIRRKQTLLPDKLNSPGPAAYGAADLNMKLNKAPQYTMRPICNRRQENVGPGPNYYDLMYHRPGKKSFSYSFGTYHSPYAPPMIVRCDNM